MNNIKKIILSGVLILFNSPVFAVHSPGSKVIEIIQKVNDYWQNHNSPDVSAFWDNAAYHTGNMEAYELIGNPKWLDYSTEWANHNHWTGATEPDTSKWVYKKYGEDQQHVLFGDWQICFQTYLDLYRIDPQPYKASRAREVMKFIAVHPAHDYWWWADALYMVMPVMTKMYRLTGDEMYLDKLYENVLYSDSIMLDKETGLYFRDAKYIYPMHKTTNGKKDFWARGDGWVLAGLAKVLQIMPRSYRHYEFFLHKYQRLAEAVAGLQQKEGYWTRSMMDPQQSPGPETSGTAFFTYGILWGINNGILNRQHYEPVIRRAWKYLTGTALQKNGEIGYVQPIGERAIPGQKVDAGSHANFGTGAFLLAACEYARYLGYQPKAPKRYVYGAFYKIRKDDIGWENDKGIYRVYGPALQRSGEKAYGVDVWVKNTPELVMNDRYWTDYKGNLLEDSLTKIGKKKEAKIIDDSTSFHINHGNGMDSYDVGPTLGCGAPALTDGKKIYYPYCYKNYQIIENGPTRFTVRLDFAPVTVKSNKNIIEHRIISLDKGSHFNSCTVWYDNVTDTTLYITAGVVLHDNSQVILGRDYVAYADPTDYKAEDKIFTAVIYPNTGITPAVFEDKDTEGKVISRHALCFYKGKPEEKTTYYFGSAWSEYDIHSLQEWKDCIEHFISENR